MSATMRELERKGEIAAEVAARQPATLREGLEAYADIRKREIMRQLWDLDATSEWRARDISFQCAALAEIQKRLAPEPAPEKKAAKKSAKVVQIAPAAVRSLRQQQVELAVVLRVDERETAYAPTLDELKREAEVAIMRHENVRANQAMGAEIDELVRFLYRVEDAAQKARGTLELEKRGGIPLDPRQIGGMRAGM